MSPPPALDFLDLDRLLSDEERLIRDTTRGFVADRILPEVAGWFERGELPRELAKELGDLGLLGMHLEGYGCAGTNAVSYGLACLELEAGDSGARSFVSVQGSLAMYPIWQYGSEEQKQRWLPPMAAGEAIGCFGLTEPDFGSNPAGMRTSARRDGGDWVLNGTKMWITNGGIADVAVVWARTDDEGVRGFLVPAGTPGFSTRDIGRKLSLRASVTSELVLEDCRLPADAVLPEVRGMRGPLSCLNEARFGIIWGSMGAARACFAERPRVRHHPRAVRPAHRRVPAHPAEAGRHAGRAVQGHPAGPAPGPDEGRGPARPRTGQPGQAQQRPRGPGHRPHAPGRSSGPTASPSSTR